MGGACALCPFHAKRGYFMSNGFYRFRRRLTACAFLRSLLFGLSGGLITFAAALAVSKITAVSFDLFFWISIGGGAALAVTAVLFLLSLRSDARVAEKLDAEVIGGDRVQTMVAFRGRDSEILRLQREDTEHRLSVTKTGKAKTRGLWVSVLTFAVAAALTAGAFVMPAKAVPPIEETPIGEYEKEWRISRLNSLIDMVQNSLMTEAARDDIVNELQALLAVVTETDLESVMRAAAIETILHVDGIIDRVNVSEDIAGVLEKSTSPTLAALGAAVASQSGTATKKQLTAVLNDLKAREQEEIIDAISDVNDELSAALRQSGGSNIDDLYRTFASLSDALSMIVDQQENASLSVIGASLTAAFNDNAGAIGEALLTERDNSLTGATVVRELMDIFSITAEDLETEIEDGDEIIGSGDESFDPPEDEDEDDTLHDGGLGTGETLYGSNDLVYDPDNDVYVEYGDILNGYYAKVLEMVSDGRVTPELEDYINRYFSTLFSGSEKPENGGN